MECAAINAGLAQTAARVCVGTGTVAHVMAMRLTWLRALLVCLFVCRAFSMLHRELQIVDGVGRVRDGVQHDMLVMWMAAG